MTQAETRPVKSNWLRRSEVRRLLDRLHAEARGDWLRFPALLPQLVRGKLRGKAFVEAVTPAENGFESATLPTSDGLEYSYYTG